ncbi:hypothetical protein DYU05_07230 [Mucilaginibacter terrenus]|uniref:SGNH hydrolase-type esterase domain-containing protein n=1 Tax=Mucilaginibacter terrenus TaxID=2482727 RepID=A0A3E2NWT1_9SPHI|nr:GDSL-type esterase/lipase family protein [Mucilaginibacter terrenus]RFZ85381.1 hypothetical protein DYU05_07230 [Mucilaginibacter terrenus]
MKYIFLLMFVPLFAMAQHKPTNQNLFDTIAFIPEHTVQRLAEFKKHPVTTGGIMFLGNSITEMGNWAGILKDTTVVNRGIGGDITYGLLKRLDDVTIRKPKKIFLLIGINDIGKDIPDSVIAYNHAMIVREIHAKSPDTKIYVESILPLNPTMPHFPQHYDKAEHIPRINKMLQANATALNYTYINLWPIFADKSGLLKAELTAEGLHLKPAAYEIWVAYLKKLKYL